ncbi:ATP-binding cassette domain-containing protein [Aurantimonas sp. Leaf443]|uniref:thiamine ABC transporter ATP-binding protein n=1 Tax=Aurantimonas sp. Leaf443 TaxID=1736378 RepID=UPI0006FDF487|nr:ATP-binding cassette domain-containing protein [Aurantimonas sp. Leaf443]KQT85160.1 thiamine ABC transporter ATP-binding protein [Aurantimonas sp. Leaf443]
MTGPALVLEGVRHAYEGREMVFDLAVETGEWLAVVGPSGAGKSTLLDLVAGFLTPSAGRILIGGEDMAGRAPGERPVNLVFQENNLFPHLTAFGNVALGLTTRRRPRPDERAATMEALRAVGLEGLAERRPAQMSGGERQRVALARAFLRRRPLMLLDEPFAALGPALRREMLDLLQGLRDRSGAPLTILMVTHHPEDALGRAGRLAFLDDGRIAAIGETRALLGGRGDPRLSAYLGTAGA